MSVTELSAIDLNNRQREETQALIAASGGDYWSAPDEARNELLKKHRLEWEEFCGRDEAVDPANRHDKTERLESFVTGNIGTEVTVPDLMDAAECSRGTANKFIADNRSTFERVRRGVYRILDTEAERAAAKSSRLAAPVAAPVSETVETVQLALDQFNGGGRA